jgi:hypothetical protein
LSLAVLDQSRITNAGGNVEAWRYTAKPSMWLAFEFLRGIF